MSANVGTPCPGEACPVAPFTVGERVTWLHVPRDGYGFVWPVDVEILHVTPKRVRIRVARRGGELVERWVRPESLKRREARP